MGGGADDQQIGTLSPRKIDQDGGLVLAFRGQRMNRHVEAVTAEVAGDVGARLRAMALRACFGVDDEDIALRAGLGEDRKSVVSGKSVSVRVDLGGRRFLKKKK